MKQVMVRVYMCTMQEVARAKPGPEIDIRLITDRISPVIYFQIDSHAMLSLEADTCRMIKHGLVPGYM